MRGRPARWPPAVPLLALLTVAACAGASDDPVPGAPVHHVEGGFRNPPGSPEPTGGLFMLLRDRLRQMFERHDGPVPPAHVVPQAQAVAALHDAGAADAITWIGHASVLLRLGGRTVLVDPVYADHPTPLAPFGPKRIVPPGLPLDALPPIDLLLITHDHYDHLDLDALERLPNRAGTEAVAPLRVGPLLREAGFARIHELDWWRSIDLSGLEITAVPAQHYSGRGLFDRDTTLWAGFVLRAGDTSVYVSGDTGYRDGLFAEIGERLGPFDLAVPFIGAYEPEPLGRAYHVTPEEAALAVRELRARRAVPVHWGTFPIGREPPFEPGPRFAAAARDAGLPEGTVRPLAIGETWAFGERSTNRAP